MIKNEKLGFKTIVLFGINSIIGTGIFLSPGGVIKISGEFAPLAYIFATLFAISLAFVYAEAAKYVKGNGAAYAYAEEAFGSKVGLYVGITRGLSSAIAWGLMATAVIKTLYDIFCPTLKNSPHINSYYLISLVSLISLLFILNLFGNKIFGIFNNISTVGKVFTLVLFVISGIAIISFAGVNNYFQAAIPFDSATGVGVYQGRPLLLFGVFKVMETSKLAGVFVATIAAVYAFTGFESIALASEEMDDNALPKAIPTAILIVAFIYISVVLVGMFLGSENIVNTTETVALAGAISNNTLRSIIIGGAVLSMLGINIAASYGSPRSFTALADRGVLPKIVAKKNKNGFPTIAFLITAIIAMAFPIALNFNVSTLIGLSVMSRFIQYLIVPLTVIKISSSTDAKWANVTRCFFKEKVCSVLGFIFSLTLVAVYDYKSVLFKTLADGTLVPNTLSISFLIIFYFAIPAYGYYYYFNKARKANQ